MYLLLEEYMIDEEIFVKKFDLIIKGLNIFLCSFCLA